MRKKMMMLGACITAFGMAMTPINAKAAGAPYCTGGRIVISCSQNSSCSDPTSLFRSPGNPSCKSDFCDPDAGVEPQVRELLESYLNQNCPGVTIRWLQDFRNQTPSCQEQIPSRQEQFPSCQEQIPSRQEQIPSCQEQTPSGQAQIPSHQEQTSSRQEQIPSRQEQIPSCQEQTPSRQEQTPSGQAQTPSLKEQTPSGQAQTPSGPEVTDPGEVQQQKPAIQTPVTIPGEPANGQVTPARPEASKTYEEQIVALVNAERAKAGLPALKTNATLQSAALARAKETVQSFSHTRPNGTSCFTILKEYGIRYRYAGENIAYGQRSPEEVVNAWMNSEGHRANILNKNFTTIGIGYYQTAGGIKYWSQLFIS